MLHWVPLVVLNVESRPKLEFNSPISIILQVQYNYPVLRCGKWRCRSNKAFSNSYRNQDPQFFECDFQGDANLLIVSDALDPLFMQYCSKVVLRFWATRRLLHMINSRSPLRRPLMWIQDFSCLLTLGSDRRILSTLFVTNFAKSSFSTLFGC